jgi:hypothetical protein
MRSADTSGPRSSGWPRRGASWLKTLVRYKQLQILAFQEILHIETIESKKQFSKLTIRFVSLALKIFVFYVFNL